MTLRGWPGAPGLAVFETWDFVPINHPPCPSSQHEPISCFYSGAMPWGLERWHGGHDLHFITFSCYRRQALLWNACPTNSFPTLMLRPGLETRETRGTQRSTLRLFSLL